MISSPILEQDIRQQVTLSVATRGREDMFVMGNVSPIIHSNSFKLKTPNSSGLSCRRYVALLPKFLYWNLQYFLPKGGLL
jgi:hypothetical protein